MNSVKQDVMTSWMKEKWQGLLAGCLYSRKYRRFVKYVWIIDFLTDLISTIMTFTFLHTKITAFATNITSCMYIKIKVSEQLVSCSRWSARSILSFLCWQIFSSDHYRIKSHELSSRLYPHAQLLEYMFQCRLEEKRDVMSSWMKEKWQALLAGLL